MAAQAEPLAPACSAANTTTEGIHEKARAPEFLYKPLIDMEASFGRRERR
jgi:hypothetical protein